MAKSTVSEVRQMSRSQRLWRRRLALGFYRERVVLRFQRIPLLGRWLRWRQDVRRLRQLRRNQQWLAEQLALMKLGF